MTGSTIDRAALASFPARLAAARDQQLAARRHADATLKAWEREGCPPHGSASYRACEEAKENRRQSELDLAALEGEQKAALVRLSNDGDGLRGRNGNGPMADGLGRDGWQQLANTLDPSKGVFQASVGLDSLMKPPMLGVTSITPPSGLTAPQFEIEGVIPLSKDTRFLYPLLKQQQVEQGDLSLAEFKQSGTRTVSGAVERDPAAVTEKAKLALGLELVTPSLKQLAIFADAVPSKLFPAVEGLGDGGGIVGAVPTGGLLLEWLRTELAYQLDKALDSHTLAQLVAAKPAFSETGTTLIQKIRNAVSAARANGANPTILAVPPKVAIELDSLEDAQKRPIFPTGAVGGSSPLYGLNVVELQSEEHSPVLIDPLVLGVVYFSLGTLLVNPFVGASKNLVDVRLEFDCLTHIRDVSGAYAISATALK
jgi:hypothetical protein